MDKVDYKTNPMCRPVSPLMMSKRARTMRIYTTWIKREGCEGEDIPEILVAIDEYTMDSHGGGDEFLKAEGDKVLKEWGCVAAVRRNIILNVPDKDIIASFEEPIVEAEVE